jgi:hypothetical protein
MMLGLLAWLCSQTVLSVHIMATVLKLLGLVYKEDG